MLVTLGVASAARAQPAAPPARVLVMPFENVTREGRIFWLGEAAAVLLTDDLNALGTSAITREERREAFERLQVPPAAVLTDATVIRLGQLVGASEVVVGSLQLEGDALVVKARTIALDAARVRHNAIERGPARGAVSDVRADGPSAGSPDRRAASDEVERQHPPIAVFESYIKGLLADTPKTAITYLTAALDAQPGFDRARLALWDVYSQQGDHQRAADAVTTVAADSPLADRARFLLGLSQLRLGRNDDAYDTYTALADVHPTACRLQQPRRDPAETGRRAANRSADRLFQQGGRRRRRPSPTSSSIWDTPTGASATPAPPSTGCARRVRRNPADGEAHYVLGAVLAASGTPAEANREKELARRLSSTFRRMGQASSG